MIRWRTKTSGLLPLLLLIPIFGLTLAVNTSPRVWLIQPQSRSLEHDPTIKKTAETKCPTMKKDTDPKSTLPAGGIIDIIWYNPFQLNGPIKFELLSGEEILAKLEPIDESGAGNEKNRSTKAIRIPDFECRYCVLRLTQFTDNTDTEVVSCADVQVVQTGSDSNNSTTALQTSKSECTADKDCGKQAECIKGACYCPSGKFGSKCEQISNLTQLASNKYTKIDLSDAARGNSLQWRYDTQAEQLEFQIEMPAESWAAIGLRNKEAGAKCKSMMAAKDSNTVEDLDADNSLNPNLNIRKIVGNYLSSTKAPESFECGPNEEFSEECPEFSRQCESSCEWTLFPESVPSCPKSCGIPRCVCKEGFVRQANDNNECRPFEYCMALQASTQQCAKNQTWAKCGTACEPSCASMYNTDPCSATCETEACSCDNNYVRHDGNCIFWGDCPNLEERVLGADGEDSSENIGTLIPIRPSTLSNRDESFTEKPQAHPECPANETWNKCGRVCETECHRIFDREECNECGPAECSCQQGFARLNGTRCVYWNDCMNGNSKSFPSNVSKKTTKSLKTTTTSSPTNNTLKSAEMPPADPEMLCFGEFLHPPRCEGTACQYKLAWSYIPEEDNVEFSLETRMNSTGWSGVGFSSTGSMTDADFIVVSSDGKTLNIKDMHADNYNTPKVDKIQNIETSNFIGTHIDGVLKATFLRKRKTGDSKDDATFGDSDEECYRFLFLIDGGELANDGTIAPHTITPMVSSTKICIRACAGQMSDTSEPKINIPTYTCQNEFHYPANCSDNNCDYRARWAYDRSDKSVMFEVSGRGIGRWVSIGWSKDGMENSDIILGWVHDGKPHVLDRFAYGRQLPVPDPTDKQDIYAIGGSVEDDMQTITFKRKLVTNDKKTDLQLDKCYYFLFPIGGGRILSRKSQDLENSKTPIGYHDLKAPERSSVPVCICDENNKPVGETPAPPAVIRRRRQVDPFDEKISPGDLSHLLPAVKKLPGGSGHSTDDSFSCTDVSLVELSKKRNVRVIDGFALDTQSMMPDEAFGGLQSLPSISVFPNKKDKKMATVVLRKKVKTDDIADFNFSDEMGSLVFASGPAGSSISDAPFVKTVALNLLDPKAPILSTNQAETITTSEPTPEITESTSAPTTIQTETSTVNTTPLIADLEETTQTLIKEDWITDDLDANCAGSFNFPSGCKPNECKYIAKWALDSQKNNMQIHLESKLPTKHYTGFGFSKDGAMANTDAIIVSVLGDSTVAVSDQFSPSYGRPTIDVSQDLKQIKTSYVDGKVVTTMVRLLTTNDKEDADLLADCHYLIFIPGGGQLEDGSNAIRKHLTTPVASKARFCPSKCQVAQTETVTTNDFNQSTKKPKVQLAGGIPPLGNSPTEDRVFDTVLRVMGREWGVSLENMQTPEAKQFTSEIVANLKPLVAKKYKSLKSIDVTNYAYSTTESVGVTEPNHGSAASILALTQFTFDAKNSPDADELRNYLKEITAQSLTGPLNVDPNAVQVQQNQKHEEDDKWGPLRDIRNWTIIGIVILILLALVFLCLCCGFCGSRRKTHPEHLSFGQPPNSSYHHYSTSYPNMGTMTYDASKADSKGTGSTDTQPVSNGASVSRRESSNVKSTAPRGIGETTYKEWYSKVASKETPSHHQESMYQTPPTRMLTNAPHSAYVTYPNDPSGYYTLNGDNRVPPPSYYRHY